MTISKREKDFLEIKKAIERFRNLSTETIQKRLNTGTLTEIGRKAYKAVLKERNIL